MQGAPEAISGFASGFGCLPLAARDIRVPKHGQALVSSLIMALAVGAAAFGLFPVAIVFAMAVAFLLPLVSCRCVRCIPPSTGR
jgi:hypothetical protein